MKIAIPLDENKKKVCVSFAREPFFLFSENGQNEIVVNPAADAQGGAGIKAAQILVDNGTEILITVRCGQNANEVFEAAQLAVYKSQTEDALENLNYFMDGKLEKLTHFHAGFQGIQ